MYDFFEWLQEKKLDYLILFVLFFALLIYLQYGPFIGDPDGYYHAKMALLLREGRLLTTMPWMQFTTLRDTFTDHHLLYHLLLIPFVSLGKPLLGAKLATVFFGASFFIVFYWTLRRLHCAVPVFFTILLASCSTFIFRLSLIKANSLSLILFLLLFVALLERRWLLVGLLNVIYVWLYGGWFLGWVAAAAVVVVALLFNWLALRQQLPWYRRWFYFKTKNIFPVFRIALATVAGSFIGLIVNPYWPQNISFYWQQVWQIAIVNKGSSVIVGGEWSSLGPAEFVAFFAFLAIFFGMATALTLTAPRRLRLRTWCSALLALLFLVFTIKSRRYIELSAPLVVLTAAAVWADNFPEGTLRKMWHAWKPVEQTKEQLGFALAVGLLIFVFLPNIGLGAQIQSARVELNRGVPLHRYEKASQWLAAHTPESSIVLHSDWDDWPMLFYFNNHNRYIVGLDPTFMYNYDASLYQRWASLTAEGTADNLVQLVTKDLRADFVIIEKNHTKMQQTFATNIYFRLAYEDDEAWVYQAAVSPTND